MKAEETFLEKLRRKCTHEPLIPLGALLTTAFLGAGLRAFHRGQPRQAQYLMRGRVLAQGFTVAVFIAGSYVGLIKKEPRELSYDEKKLLKVQGGGGDDN
jgi:hypothetical protein